VVERPHAEATVNEVATEPQVEQPTHYWTWRLLSSGFTPDECAVVRALDPEVVLDHALRAADAGLPIQAGWFLSEEQIRQIEAVVGSPGVARIRPLLERLPRGTRYEAVQLVLKARGQTCSA
jgi:ATP-dependent DNA helicase RecQ